MIEIWLRMSVHLFVCPSFFTPSFLLSFLLSIDSSCLYIPLHYHFSLPSSHLPSFTFYSLLSLLFTFLTLHNKFDSLTSTSTSTSPPLPLPIRWTKPYSFFSSKSPTDLLFLGRSQFPQQILGLRPLGTENIPFEKRK